MLSDEQLLEKRLHGDDLADQVVADIISQGNGQQVAELFNTLTTNVDVPTSLLPPAAIDYFRDTKTLPSYYDSELIKQAHDVYSLYGPEISMILLCKSLPQCYACGKGAKVLYHTGRLIEHDGNFEILTRRLMETSQFVVNVLKPGSFEENGNAIITTQKVRLIHASIRHFIKQSGRWDTDYYGVPINQEDMAGTLLSFSSLVIEGLEQIGIHLSDAQKEAFFHLWRVVGHFNGLEPDLIPETHEEGLKLGYAIFDQQLLSTKEGIALTDGAIGFMKKVTPGKLFDHVPEALTYHFLGEKVSEVVGLVKPRGFMNNIVPTILSDIFGEYERVENRVHGLNKISGRFNRAFLQGMLNYFNKHKQINFDIPPSLQEDWDLN